MGRVNDDKRFIGQGGYMPTKAEEREELSRVKKFPDYARFHKHKKVECEKDGYESYAEYVERTKPWE